MIASISVFCVSPGDQKAQVLERQLALAVELQDTVLGILAKAEANKDDTKISEYKEKMEGFISTMSATIDAMKATMSKHKQYINGL